MLSSVALPLAATAPVPECHLLRLGSSPQTTYFCMLATLALSKLLQRLFPPDRMVRPSSCMHWGSLVLTLLLMRLASIMASSLPSG